jgi:cytochrome c553
MKRKIVIALLLSFGLILIIVSCKQSGCSNSHVSTYNSHESQKMTGNCMGCHSPNGGGSGCFRVAGTAFDSIPGDSAVKGAIVKLYTQPNGMGELIVTLQVDSSGNFYTTSPVSFGNGLYPAIISKTGTRYMPTATITGACNSCHGVANASLWAD